MRVVAVVGGRGGTGKTTTVLAAAAALAARGVRVAIVDADPQASATIWSASGVLTHDGRAIYRGGRPILTRQDPVADPLTAPPVELSHPRIPAGGVLLYRGGRSLAEVGAADLTAHFRRAASGRDVVLVDCEPAIRSVTPTAVRGAALVLVPMQPTPGSLPGLGDVLQLVQCEQPGVRMRIAFTAVPNRAISRVIAEQVAAAFPGQLYQAQVPSDVAAASSVSAFLPVTLWRPSSASAKAYAALSEEIANDLGLSLAPLPSVLPTTND